MKIPVDKLDFFSVENAFDGNPATKWSSLLSFALKEEFIALDLGEIKKLQGIDMYASKLFGTDFFPTDFQIQVSSDNLNWTNISSERGYITPMHPPYNGHWVFDSIECRYLRISIAKSKTLFFLFHLAQIGEIEIYGCDIAEHIPQVVQRNMSVRNDEYQEEYKNNNLTPSRNSDQEVPSIPGRPEITFPE